jgi:molecular chaperone GrpE
MTKKKDKKDIEATENTKSTETEHDIIKERMEAEPDLLEEKVGAELNLLEYYSKDDLIKQIKVNEEILKENDKIIKNLQDWKQKFIHLQAEFENANKRWDKSRNNLKIQYTASVLKSFLPLYDSFKKAIDSSSQESEVLTQFYNQFLSILKFQGAERIEIKEDDLFDYSIHEALTSLEKEDTPENTILDVVQDGWKLGNDILRYSKVVISKKPKPPEPEPEPEKEEKKETEPEEEDIKLKEEVKEQVIETKDDDEEPQSNQMIDNNSENQVNSNPNEKSNK